MSSSHLIICEKSSRWAGALRAALAGRPPQVVETRSLASAMTRLAQSPASLVFVEVNERNAASVLEWLDKIHCRFPLARAVVAIDPTLASLELHFRESGSMDVLYSTQQAPSVARLARRHFARTPSEQLDLSQWIAERMPWSAYAPVQG